MINVDAESVPMSELGRMMGGEVLRGIRGGLQTILKSCPDVFSGTRGCYVGVNCGMKLD